MPLPRRSFLAAGALAVTAGLAPATFALGALVDLQIVDRLRNEALPVWRHGGDSWVAGRPGARYAVRLSNRSGARVLVVLSVDGVNAVSGETAQTGQTGYVLVPWQTTEITGWRKSQTEAAAFYFTALPDSYAARTDRPDNVGVIGVAVFRERVAEPAPAARPFDRAELAPAPARGDAERGRVAESAAPAQPSAAAPRPESTSIANAAVGTLRDERLGTGHGEREYAPTASTTFERASERPAELVRLRYDSVERLQALGVIPSRRAPLVPDPFPGFVPDPKA